MLTSIRTASTTYTLGNDKPVSIEIHKFLEKCKTLDKSIRFMVFPTDVDTYVVTADRLREDIQEHLDELILYGF